MPEEVEMKTDAAKEEEQAAPKRAKVTEVEKETDAEMPAQEDEMFKAAFAEEALAGDVDVILSLEEMLLRISRVDPMIQKWMR